MVAFFSPRLAAASQREDVEKTYFNLLQFLADTGGLTPSLGRVWLFP